MTDAYVKYLADLGRSAGFDASRLAAEVADHLAEAAARNRAAGMDPSEAERRAISEIGDAKVIVAAIAADLKGGPMARVARTARIVATVGAVIATAVLLGIHMELSSAAAGTAIQPVVVAAAVALAISVAALAWTWIPFQSEAEGPSLRRSVAWAAPVLALGALSAWGGRFGGFSLPGRAYLACVALLALLVALASRAMRLREGTGLGLLVAGVISLVLNGALGGTWRPMGAIGEGQANLALELILVGWIILAGIWIAGPSAAPIRGWLGRSLVSVGDRLSPGAAVPETERGSTP